MSITKGADRMTKNIRGKVREIVVYFTDVGLVKEVVYHNKHFPIGKEWKYILVLDNDYGIFEVNYQNNILTIKDNLSEEEERNFELYPKIEVGL